MQLEEIFYLTKQTERRISSPRISQILALKQPSKLRIVLYSCVFQYGPDLNNYLSLLVDRPNVCDSSPTK